MLLGLTIALTLTSACSRSDIALDAATSSTTSAAPTSSTTSDAPASTTTTTEDTDTATTTTSTTTSPPPRCAPASGPVDHPGQSERTADLDGDGRTDRILVWRDQDGLDHLTIAFADGGSLTAGIATDSPSVRPESLGAADVDVDGTPEVFVGVGSGASAALVGVFALDDCTVDRTTIGDEPAVFAVGGSVGSIAGASCEPVPGGPGIVVRSGTSSDGDRYEGQAKSYLLEGSAFRLVETLDVSTSRGQPGFDRFTSLRCGAVAVG